MAEHLADVAWKRLEMPLAVAGRAPIVGQNYTVPGSSKEGEGWREGISGCSVWPSVQEQDGG
jgi:hypothetical protein